MSDFDRLLRQADRVVSPDLWPDIQRRQPTEPPGHRLVAGVVALAVSASGIALVAIAFFGDRPQQVPSTAPIRPEVSTRIDVGGSPSSIAAGEGAVWVGVQAEEVSSGEDGVVRIDPATNEIVARIPLKQPPTQLVAGFGAVWAAGFEGDKGSVIYRIDPANNRVVDEIRDASQPMAIGHGVLWASRHDPDTERSALLRIDPATNRVESLLPLPLSYPSYDIEVGPTAVWVLAQGATDLVEVDPETTGVLRTHDLDPVGTHMALHDGLLWMAGWEDDGEIVQRFDPQTGSFTDPISVMGFAPFDTDSEGVWFHGEGRPPVRGVCRLNSKTFVVDACVDPGLRAETLPAAVLDEATGTIWFAHYRRWVSRIDLVPSATPDAKEVDLDPSVTAEIPVGQFPQEIAVGERAVWVTVNDAGSPQRWFVARIDPGTGEVTSEIDIQESVDVAVGAGSVWVVGVEPDSGSAVFRLDSNGRVEATISLECFRECYPSQIAAGGGKVWVTASTAYPNQGEIIRIDAERNEIIGRTTVQGDPRDLVIGEGGVWVYSLTHFTEQSVAGGTIYRLDPSTGEVTATLLEGRVPPAAGTSSPPVLAVGHGFVWTSSAPGNPIDLADHQIDVVRLDPTSGRITGRIALGSLFFPFGVDDSGIWFRGGPEDASPIIARLDPVTMRVGAEQALDRTVLDGSLDHSTGTIWLSTYRDSVLRIDLNPSASSGS